MLITGDHEQLAAVEGGGGMVMLTRQMGYIQLAEPVRFVQEWERDATLRLRAGDTAVLAQYEEQGRLRGGDPEEAMDLACRAFVADHLAGKDSLLLARTGEQAREMSRRVRDDLLHYGLVRRRSRGQAAARRDRQPGRPDRRPQKQPPDHRGSAGPVAGQPRRAPHRRRHRAHRSPSAAWRGATATAGQSGRMPFELPKSYLFSHCDLAYATTPHAAQGRTVDTSHVLVDGLGDRQGLYVAMSRGRDANYAYCVTGFPRAADTREGSRPAPELARMRRLTAERAGLGPGTGLPAPTSRSARNAMPCRSSPKCCAATEQFFPQRKRWRSELSNADHLGALGSIWYDLARRAQAATVRAGAARQSPGRRRRCAQRPGVHLAVAVAARSRSSRAGRAARSSATRSRSGR